MAIFYCTLAIVMSILSLWYSANALHVGASLATPDKKDSQEKKPWIDAKREQSKEESKAKVFFILDSTNYGA